MKKIIHISIIACIFMLGGNAMYGQIFKKLKNKLEDKVVNKADDILDGKDSQNTSEDKSSGVPNLSNVYDFTPGTTVIFRDSIQYATLGNMPKYWKSGGTGAVVEIPGAPGKWLNLTAFTTYKLDTLLAMPENFTIEFDILTRSNELQDLHSIAFGFSSDNSVSNYGDNILSETEVHYWNQEVMNRSTDVDSYNSYDFDLQNYGNAVMHVSISVVGQNMKVYLDQNKILDKKMFQAGRRKYFFIQPSTRLDNNAILAINNFIVAKK